MTTQIERTKKKMEKALKNELILKDEELLRRSEAIKEARSENDKLVDDMMMLKKENFSLISKVEVLDIEIRNKTENESKIRMQEMKQLKEKEGKYYKTINELKETLKKKQRIIDNKKKMNLLLVDLAKINKKKKKEKCNA